MQFGEDGNPQAEVLILRPSKWLWLSLAFGSALFTGAVLWIDALHWSNAGAWTLPVGTIFFGFCTLVIGAYAVLPGAGELRLDDEGFTWTVLFKKRRYRWEDVIEPFRVISIAGLRVVSVDLRPEIYGQGVLSSVSKWNKRIDDASGALLDTYGLGPDRLAALLNEWRERALT